MEDEKSIRFAILLYSLFKEEISFQKRVQIFSYALNKAILKVIEESKKQWEPIHPIDNPEEMRKIYGWSYDQGGKCDY